MNNNQIFDEMRAMIDSLSSQLDILKEKLDEISLLSAPLDTNDVVKEDTSEAEVQTVAETVEETVEETQVQAQVQTQEAVEEAALSEVEENVEMAAEDELMPESDIPIVEIVDIHDSVSLAEDDENVKTADSSVPEPVQESEPVQEPEQPDSIDLPEADVPIIDALLKRHAWKSDIPGSKVKDVRSAISLNDRVLFINTLFNQDPSLFQSVVQFVNSVESLDEVLYYLSGNYPAWDYESDVVYRFMMAVRRKVD